jgi:hypothetical protein
MKKLTVIAVGLVSALMLAVAAGAGGPPKATGGIWMEGASGVWVEHVTFNAQGTETDAKGQINFYETKNGALWQQFHGIVDCYFQQDNEAWFSGTVDDLTLGTGNTNGHLIFQVHAVDNGEGANALADRFEFSRPAALGAGPCGGQEHGSPVTSGNLQVH